MMPSLDRARANEQRKYLQLQRWMPQYGASNHGKDATPYVLNKSPQFVVDFGCGRNNFIENLKSNGVEGVGVDFVYDEAYIKSPMHKAPLEDNCADFITAFDSLEHLLPQEVGSVFNEMCRIAKPRAAYIFSISYVPSNIVVHRQNLHPTVKPESWWIKRIREFATVSKKGTYLRGRFKNESI